MPGSDVLAGSDCGTPAAGAYLGRCSYGARLPFLVISPWTKRNFVDHTTTDQTSILRFIENNWKLGRIDDLDHPGGTPSGQASFDQIAGSILNMFGQCKSESQRTDAWSAGCLLSRRGQPRPSASR